MLRAIRLASPSSISFRRSFSSTVAKMQIDVGDRLPAATFMTLTLPDEGCTVGKPVKIESSEIFAGKTVVLVGVPGAFTPTCMEKHVPSFIKRFDEFRNKGIDKIAVVATNDAYVMAYWAKQLGNQDKLMFISDGNGKFAKDMGLLVDLGQHMMGNRCKRFAAVVKDGIVKYMGVDSGPVLESAADTVLANLK